MKNISVQFRKSLYGAVKKMKDSNDECILEIIEEWEEESNELIAILKNSDKYLDSKIFCETLEYHHFNLEKQVGYLETSFGSDEQLIEDTLDLLSDYIFRVCEDIESVMPMVEKEVLEQMVEKEVLEQMVEKEVLEQNGGYVESLENTEEVATIYELQGVVECIENVQSASKVKDTKEKAHEYPEPEGVKEYSLKGSCAFSDENLKIIEPLLDSFSQICA